MASLPRRRGRLGLSPWWFSLLVACCCICAAQGSRGPLSSAPGRRLQASCDQSSFPSLTPTITRAPVVDLKWLDPEDEKIIAITKKTTAEAGGLWQSQNGGRTWVEETGALNATVPKTEVVDIIAVLRKKSDPANIVVLGAGSWYWTSSNSGKAFTSHQTPTKWRGMSISFFKEHPTQEDWLLLLVKRPDCRALDRAQMQCPLDLMYTPNLYSGNPTWVNLTEKSGGKIAGFVDFDWARNLCPKGDCKDMMSLKDETILATMYAKPGDYDQPWDPDVHFVTSHTWFESFMTSVRCGNMFEIIGSHVYLAMANSCPTDINGKQRRDTSAFPQGISLYTSTDGGCMFTQACMPSAIKQEGYELLETHDGTGAIVIVDFLVNSNMLSSSVYTAGPHHALFSLSLTDVYHSDYSFNLDFARIEGLPGVYITNQMLPRPEVPDQDVYDLSDLTGSPLVETRITFSGGARWQRIPAPTTFNYPACNRCNGQAECYLHLHGMSAWDSILVSLPAVYSNPSAPGIIMSSGNVGVPGVGLDDNDGLCTWMSTDGGATWRDVAVGTYIYEYADWGGFVVMGRHPGGSDKAADEILFSYDGGQCWNRVPLDEALLLDNIRIEPDGQRPRVVIHGRRCRQSTHPSCAYTADMAYSGASEGLLYLLDLQDLLGKKMGMCVDTDRELWGIPSDLSGSGTRCVLGRQSLLQRRRFNVACFNGPDYVRPAPLATPCNCTAEVDLECDYGYVRTGAVCQPIPAARMPTCPVVESGKYLVSSTGKRLVHGDTCANVAAVLPDTDGKGTATRPSGDSSGAKSGSARWAWFGILLFILSVLVLGGAFVAWWVYLASEVQRDVVRDLAAGAADFVHSAKLWVLEKISGRRQTLVAEHDLGYFQPIGDNGPGEEAPLFTIK